MRAWCISAQSALSEDTRILGVTSPGAWRQVRHGGLQPETGSHQWSHGAGYRVGDAERGARRKVEHTSSHTSSWLQHSRPQALAKPREHATSALLLARLSAWPVFPRPPSQAAVGILSERYAPFKVLGCFRACVESSVAPRIPSKLSSGTRTPARRRTADR